MPNIKNKKNVYIYVSVKCVMAKYWPRLVCRVGKKGWVTLLRCYIPNIDQIICFFFIIYYLKLYSKFWTI